MKKNTHYLILPFFISVLCFFLFSCSKEENQQSALHLQILKTETNMNHKGGYVLIQTNVEGAEVRVKDAWLTPEISGSQIRLTALDMNQEPPWFSSAKEMNSNNSLSHSWESYQ